MNIGQLEILEVIPPIRLENGKKTAKKAKVKCFCGNVFTTNFYQVKSYKVKSCGCYFDKVRKNQKPNFKGGFSSSPLYPIYHAMINRCVREDNPNYKYYGLRGITVCDEWKKDIGSFIKWATENGWEKGLSLDREKNDQGYTPQNCRFVSAKINNINRRNTKMVYFDGQESPLSVWSEKLGIPYPVLYRNIFVYGNSIETSFSSKIILKREKTKKMVDQRISKEIKGFLKREGRRQRWLVDKLASKGVDLSETQMSNKLNAIMAFTREEVDAINDVLGTCFVFDLEKETEENSQATNG